MNKTSLGLLSVLAAIVIASVISFQPVSAISQKEKDIVGRWDLMVMGTDAPYPSWLEVTNTGDQLSGRFVGRFGSARPIKQISFKDGSLNFSLPPQFEKRNDELTFTGKLAGGKLSGTTIGDDGKTLTWSGVRAPVMTPTANPKWGQPIQLFNGKDISGWKLRSSKSKPCWTVEDGMLTNIPSCVDLITEQKFKDFKLSLEFKIIAESNSGVYLRGRHEVQIVDDFGKAPESHGQGGVYGFITPKVNASKKPSEWQSYEITLLGNQVTVVLNGQTVIDHQEIPGITGGALESNEGAPGPLMLQGDHGKVWFKNITLTPAK